MNEGLVAKVLAEEATNWRSLQPADSDRALCALFDAIDQAANEEERLTASLELAGAGLARNGLLLSASRARIGGQMLALLPTIRDPVLLDRAQNLLLLAWRQLVASVQIGGVWIARTPDLPDGVTLPSGADPGSIADPALRARAFELVDRHREAVERWNAKQSALEHLRRIAQAVVAARTTDDTRFQRLITEMSQTPGLPSDLRRTLEARPPAGGSGPGSALP